MNQIMYIWNVLGAYVIGGVPTGYTIARLWGIDDIRNHGSGNIGATNVARVLGAPFFILIFCIDAGKAFATLYLNHVWYDVEGIYLLGIVVALLLGNCYTPFFNFRGGKGVATSAGILLFLQPYVLLMVFCLWAFALLITHTVGVASVLAALGAPVIAWLLYPCDWLLGYSLVIMTMIIVLRHHTNIRRYFGG
jgi:glycerol-3-phosphate acyltransferase PlsY